ncbi:MAG TPA: glycosyltransferase family 2 protein [Oscillospiraceae bacterium]|nr:glycosyltransferase family 2 protein [Oscillospiraceae bacterium]HPF56345.1 glycosyltransferase family 2 protein [Clostridiales bacterium]HPK35998.1 glycosyltransferase family 2 protein [Oscillospiraceae bacterium]HPR76653.1 glycosyltransferase family 2 protein [Oscillospiraceae bacterium]
MAEKTELAILMATYNGEKFLAEQLDSLLRQDFQNWTLLVSDDGSKDGTITLLRDYAGRFPDKIRLIEKEKPSGGAKQNFFFLTRQAEGYRYIMYCDQDDIWKPEKIRLALEKMKALENGSPDTPCLVHTDLEVVDENLGLIAPSFIQYSGLNPRRNALSQLLTQNVVTGCTMMINRALWKWASVPTEEDSILMHDWWFALIASAAGKIGFIPQPLILYRQHGGNAVGAKDGRGLRAVLYHLKNFNYKKHRQALIDTMIQAGQLLKLPNLQLDEREKNMLRDYANGAQTGKLRRIYITFKYRIWKSGLIRKVAQVVHF